MRGVPNGTAAAPGIAFETDPNTGIYRPGADQLAVATNGTGRLFVNASGQVSIGSSASGAPLNISEQGAAGAPLFRFIGNSGNGNYMRGGWFASDNTTQLARLAVDGTAAMYFGTVSSTPLIITTNSTERLRIDSSGNVGIGTSSPQTLLELSASNSNIPSGDPPLNILRFNDTDPGTAGGQPTGRIEFYVNDAGAGGTGVGSFIEGAAGGSTGGGRIRFGTSNSGATGASTKVVIDDSGFVGIGTTSPVFGVGDGLEVARSGVATVRVSSNSQGVELRSDAGTGTLETRGAFPLVLGIGGTERARIDSSGRLLVGTSTAYTVGSAAGSVQIAAAGPSSFSVSRYSGNAFPPVLSLGKSRGTSLGAYTATTTGDQLGLVEFAGSDGTDLLTIGASIFAVVDGAVASNSLPTSLAFTTTTAASPTERMRIDSSGRLLVGTSTSVNDTFGAAQLQVSTTSTNMASFARYSDNAFSPTVVLKKSRGGIGAQGLVSLGDTLGELQFAGSDGAGFVRGASIYATVDGTPGANDMPGRLVFSTTADGAATPTERMRITSDGTILVGTTATPTGAGSGAVVAQDRVVIGSVNAGLHQLIVGEVGTVTATTGVQTFKFVNLSPDVRRAAYVKLSVANRQNGNTPSNSPAAEYAFQLHATSAGVCSLNGATTVFEYTYVYATHLSFANLGSGECTVTLTNPTGFDLNGAYKIELLTQGGFFTLDSVTVT
jgi:hypothetical protein